VSWSASLVQQSVLGHGCDGVEVALFESSGGIALELPASFGDLQPSLVNVAPLHGDTALLGEAGKVTAVSVFRFAKVTCACPLFSFCSPQFPQCMMHYYEIDTRQTPPAPDGLTLEFCLPAKVTTSGRPGGQLSVEVRGAPSEKVELLFAKRRPSGSSGSKFVCVAKTVTIGPGGTAIVDSGD
jgi:hypothetical protein